MNLASILNLTPAPASGTAPANAAATPETALLQEFAALLDNATAESDLLSGESDTAATGGNILPDPAAPLPDLVPQLPDDTQVVSAEAVAQLPLPTGTLDQTGTPEMAARPATGAVIVPGAIAAAPKPLPVAPKPDDALHGNSPQVDGKPAIAASIEPSKGAAGSAMAGRPTLHVQVEAQSVPALPPATARNADPAASAVLATVAQQIAPQVVPGKPLRNPDPVAPAVAAPTAASSTIEARLGESASPLAPVAAAPTPTPLVAEAPRIAESVAQPSAPATPTDRHDFASIVDRLAEAREMAQPGRASLQLAHREFGAVSVQFDMAGQSLKVALTSADAAFAPTAQAALSERPILAPGEAQAARGEAQQGHSGSSASTQAEGQRSEHQSRGQQARAAADQVQRQPREATGDEPSSARRARDTGLFA